MLSRVLRRPEDLRVCGTVLTIPLGFTVTLVLLAATIVVVVFLATDGLFTAVGLFVTDFSVAVEVTCCAFAILTFCLALVTDRIGGFRRDFGRGGSRGLTETDSAGCKEDLVGFTVVVFNAATV